MITLHFDNVPAQVRFLSRFDYLKRAKVKVRPRKGGGILVDLYGLTQEQANEVTEARYPNQGCPPGY